MVLPVVRYGDPVLRRRGAPVVSFDSNLRQLIADMFDTMYSAKGIGLAAQQVGHAAQLTVLDLRGVRDRPSQLWLQGHPADVESFMPLVLINPTIRPIGDPELGPEGCLSFPEIYGEVLRPGLVEVSAMNERGEPFEFKAGGLLSRAIQHEVDHLNGLLFIDRMSSAVRNEVRDEVDQLQAETKKAMSSKKR